MKYETNKILTSCSETESLSRNNVIDRRSFVRLGGGIVAGLGVGLTISAIGVWESGNLTGSSTGSFNICSVLFDVIRDGGIVEVHCRVYYQNTGNQKTFTFGHKVTPGETEYTYPEAVTLNNHATMTTYFNSDQYDLTLASDPNNPKTIHLRGYYGDPETPIYVATLSMSVPN